MKFIYIYSNNSIFAGDSIDEFELLMNEEETRDLIFHSKEISNKTINKEKKDNKFLHILKKHTNAYGGYYKYYASYCV